ncbi:SHOCT domain-containing protein [Kitasatospora sp. NPDC101155]|uniref:SHOCT domain-containing protein n=1 Tax=Kitasatospora sp. NPDC101155 TaxID=3364097 RepID=UPI003815142F
MYWNGMDGWAIGLMTVTTVLFWALVAYAMVVLFRHPGKTAEHGAEFPTSTAASPVRRTPEEVLAERLTRGEIDSGEYRTRLDALHGGGDPPASD